VHIALAETGFLQPRGESKRRHCGHGGSQGGRVGPSVPDREHQGRVAVRDATRRALARARRRDRVRSDNDAVASQAGQVLTGRRAPRGTRPAMTWTRRDVSGAVVSPRRAQRGGPPRSPPVSPSGPDKEGQSSGNEPRALSRSSSRRCTMLCLRLQRPIMRDYVTLTGPTDGATAAGGGQCCLRSVRGEVAISAQFGVSPRCCELALPILLMTEAGTLVHLGERCDSDELHRQLDKSRSCALTRPRRRSGRAHFSTLMTSTWRSARLALPCLLSGTGSCIRGCSASRTF
jgi:hypothetical protein